MMPPEAIGGVQVTVKVVGRRHVQPSEQAWQIVVPPTLGAALPALAVMLEQYVPAELLHGCLVILNGRNVQALTVETELRNGDVFMIVPPVAGGC